MAVRVSDLLAGIGGLRLAFERVGAECVFACEMDEEARRVYEENWGHEVDAKDIRDIEPADIPEYDVLLAGWPCPSFSIIGDRDGLNDDRGSLIFEIIRLLEGTQPDAFLLENVKNVATMEEGRILEVIREELEEVGYSVQWRVLNALDFGLPQHRERLIIVGFREQPDDFTIPDRSDPLTSTEERREALDDVLVDDPPDKYVASEEIRSARREAIEADPSNVPEPSVWHENRSQNVAVNPYSCALRANASWNYQLINGRRHPTPRELLRLQGFPDWFDIPGGSYTRVRQLTGNTVPVPVVEAVAEEMVDVLE